MEITGWLLDKPKSSTHEIPEQNHEMWGDIRLGLLRDGLKTNLQMCHNIST